MTQSFSYGIPSITVSKTTIVTAAPREHTPRGTEGKKMFAIWLAGYFWDSLVTRNG